MEALSAAATKAQRRGKVAFPPSFVRAADDGGTPPLARMIQGGRGGKVRLKLYLCITMLATRAPYDLRQSSPTPQSWSRLLGLPPDTGPRQVSSNLRWLKEQQFVSLEPRIGQPPAITLLNVTGDGSTYTDPRKARYVGVPIELWTQGWLLDLTATGLALLLVLLDALGGKDEPRYVTNYARRSYGLSPDTWTRARKELEGHGLLTVGRTPQGSDYDYYRLRNTYWINKSRLNSPPER